MTRVSFYLLALTDLGARECFACRLTEKAYRQGHSVYLHTADETQAEQLDELLWTYRAPSFIPHGQFAEHKDEPDAPPVVIGFGNDPGPYHDVMVNLALDIPDFFSRFERVTEIVIEEETVRTAKRDCFRFYRDRGYPSEHHRVGNVEL